MLSVVTPAITERVGAILRILLGAPARGMTARQVAAATVVGEVFADAPLTQEGARQVLERLRAVGWADRTRAETSSGHGPRPWLYRLTELAERAGRDGGSWYRR